MLPTACNSSIQLPGTTLDTGIQGVYNGTNLALGAFGYDSTTQTAWAVVDHTGDFAVVPEPATWAMFVGGIGMLGFIQRLRRRSNNA